MTSQDWLAPVRAALDRRKTALKVFFRDDDVGWSTDRALVLVDVFERRRAPLDLAVIPATISEGDANLLRDVLARSAGRIRVHQHGFAHANHEPRGKRKCEFGPSRSAELQTRDIRAGKRRLAELLGDFADPIFTPPWNRCTQATVTALVDAGIRVLSRDRSAAPLSCNGVLELPIAVDWTKRTKDGRRFGPHDAAVALADRIDAAAPAEAVGIMLHHALLDRSARDRIDELLVLLVEHPHVRLRTMRELACSEGVQ